LKERSPALSYLPGLDGLRALAVIGVLLYHADLAWIPGGFLGVEVFFVISGYLITSLLLAEWRQQGRIDLKAFWLRRARRLLPAAVVLIVSTLAFAVVFLPQEVAGLRGDALAAFGYVTNWSLILSHKSYFESVGRPPLLRHLWSLAIEGQFYLLWPLLFAAGMRLWRRRRTLLITLVGAAVSTALMAILYRPDVDPSRIYFGTDTRVAGLLIGAALALVWTPERLKGRAPSLWLDVIGLGALAGLVGFCLRLDEFQPLLYRGGFALVALTTAVAIAVAVHPRARLVPGLLSQRLLRWVGLRSYSIYLWHWPVYMVTRPQLDVSLEGWPLLALRLAITGVLAELSYRYVETPFRRGALGRAWKTWRAARGARRRWLDVQWGGIAGGIVALALILGMSVAAAQPPAVPDYLAVEAVQISATDDTLTMGNPASLTDLPIGKREAPATPPAESLTLTPEPVADAPVTQDEADPIADMPSRKMLLSPVSGSALGSLSASASALMFASSPVSASVNTSASAVRVTAIGDSVMLGAVGELRRAIAFSARQFDEMMQILAGARKVVILNVKVPRHWEAPNNTVLTEGVKQYPNAVLVDWRAASANKPELFWSDGLHIRPEGARIYADLIAAYVNAPEEAPPEP
jgi:peptidoglycan/LPS O-acetylase OafA/YrhL